MEISSKLHGKNEYSKEFCNNADIVFKYDTDYKSFVLDYLTLNLNCDSFWVLSLEFNTYKMNSKKKSNVPSAFAIFNWSADTRLVQKTSAESYINRDFSLYNVKANLLCNNQTITQKYTQNNYLDDIISNVKITNKQKKKIEKSYFEDVDCMNVYLWLFNLGNKFGGMLNVPDGKKYLLGSACLNLINGNVCKVN